MKTKRAINILFPLTILTACAAALAGILADTVYSRELPAAAVRFVSRDYIILFGIVPLSIAAFFNRLKDRLWAGICILGISLYLLGAAAFNLFSLRMNGMFFLHAAVLALSLFTVLIEFPAAAAVQAVRKSAEFPGKRVVSIALFYLVVSILQFWSGDILPALIYRQVPESVKYLHVTVNAAAVFDLCLMVPLMFIGAVFLWRGKPKGIVLAAASIIRLLFSRISGIAAEAGLLGAGMEHNGVTIAAFGFDILVSLSMLILMIRQTAVGGRANEKNREKRRNETVAEQSAC